MLNEADRAALEILKRDFPIPEKWPKGSFERKIEENRRQIVVERWLKRYGPMKIEWGWEYGPFYTLGGHLQALQADREVHPGLYLHHPDD